MSYLFYYLSHDIPDKDKRKKQTNKQNISQQTWQQGKSEISWSVDHGIRKCENYSSNR